MTLSVKNWKFLRDIELGLRHIADPAMAAMQITEGMTGDAVPLSTAAEVIHREMTGEGYEKAMLQAMRQRLPDAIGSQAEVFEQRLREKIEHVVNIGFANNNTGDLGKSVFMLVTGIGKHYSNSDYETNPDTYPLGKVGRSFIAAEQVALSIMLDGADRRRIASGLDTPAGIITVKIIDAIPALQEKLMPEILPGSKFAAGGASLTEWSIERAVREKAQDIENWFGGRGIDTLDTGQKALATLSLHAQQFIDGLIPEGRMKDEIAQFGRNLKTLVEHDAMAATQFGLSVMRHPALQALAETGAEAYRDGMNALKSSDAGCAISMAKDHLQVYGDVAAVATVATAVLSTVVSKNAPVSLVRKGAARAL